MNDKRKGGIFRPIRAYLRRLNISLILTGLAAFAFSVLLLYTMNLNEISSKVSDHQWKMQVVCAGIGLFAALVITAINYRSLVKIWWLYTIPAYALVMLVFTPLGTNVEGTDDLGWIDFGFATLQPSEILKPVFIFTFAAALAHSKDRGFGAKLLAYAYGLVPAALIIATGDDGTALVFALTAIVMIFASGIKWRYVLGALMMLPPAAFVMWEYFMKPHQKIRVQVILDAVIREQEMTGKYYQQYRSLIALGMGGLTGQGLSGGDYIYVAEIYNDFIFAYVGMTLGLVGCVAAAALLIVICAQTVAVAVQSRDEHGRMICIGVFAVILVQSVINIGMVLAVFPVVGVPLPFLSAGGSSILGLFISLGLVLSVYANREKKYHIFYEES